MLLRLVKFTQLNFGNILNQEHKMMDCVHIKLIWSKPVVFAAKNSTNSQKKKLYLETCLAAFQLQKEQKIQEKIQVQVN